jgi:hypothetical protein
LFLQAVRDQIRKMVVGGPLVAEDKSRGIDAVSDSEDDETELAAMERDVGRWVYLPLLFPWGTAQNWVLICASACVVCFAECALLLQSCHAVMFIGLHA